MARHNVTCVYCDRVTGYDSKPGVKSVCAAHQWKGRDEAREVAAGMRPWSPVYPVLSSFLGDKELPPDERAKAQANWDAEQRRIAEYNAAHGGRFHV